MNKPMVSVCMITYNHEKYIAEAIQGVLMQVTDFDVEFIIANDASTDHTHSIITQLAADKSNITIKYINHPQNLGMMPNFIFALNQCSGKYIALCEGDDYWTDPLKLQKQVDFLEGNPDFGSCFASFIEYDQNDNTFSENPRPQNLTIDPNYGGMILNTESYFKGWYTQLMTALFRSEIINKIKFSGFKYFQDTHLTYSILDNSNSICFPEVVGVYRKHNSGVYSGLDTDELTYRHYKLYEDLFLHYPSRDLRLLKKARKRFSQIKERNKRFVNFYERIKVLSSKKILFTKLNNSQRLYLFRKVGVSNKLQLLSFVPSLVIKNLFKIMRT